MFGLWKFSHILKNKYFLRMSYFYVYPLFFKWAIILFFHSLSAMYVLSTTALSPYPRHHWSLSVFCHVLSAEACQLLHAVGNWQSNLTVFFSQIPKEKKNPQLLQQKKYFLNFCHVISRCWKLKNIYF